MTAENVISLLNFAVYSLEMYVTLATNVFLVVVQLTLAPMISDIALIGMYLSHFFITGSTF